MEVDGGRRSPNPTRPNWNFESMDFLLLRPWEGTAKRPSLLCWGGEGTAEGGMVEIGPELAEMEACGGGAGSCFYLVFC